MVITKITLSNLLYSLSKCDSTRNQALNRDRFLGLRLSGCKIFNPSGVCLEVRYTLSGNQYITLHMKGNVY